MCDRRDSRYTDHDLRTIITVAQDLPDSGNDADVLRRDPSLKAACDRNLRDADLASQPTLSRTATAKRYFPRCPLLRPGAAHGSRSTDPLPQDGQVSGLPVPLAVANICPQPMH